MDLTHLKKHQSYIIVALLLLFMGIALILRMIPALFIKDPGFLYIFDTDSWYTMRQIEVMVKDFPQYNWFDPMTAYPTGKVIDWGPLYPFIAAILSLITGATTRSGIIYTSGWVAPLMAVIMVPVMFQLGKTVWNGKAGIVAAGLISVVSIQYFSLSSYGWADHHIAEVLFSTLFFLTYIFTLIYVKSHPINLKQWKTLIFPVFLSTVTGITFFLALLSSTTVILALIIIAVYTLIQYILDYFSNQDSSYLLGVNVGVFLVSIILLFLFGFKQESLALTQYSIGIVYVYCALIAETIVLFILSAIFRGKKLAYLASLVVLAAGSLFLIQSIPLLQMIRDQVLGLFFGFSVYSVAVVETLPWTLSGAWENFTIALILMAGGLLVLGYSLVKKRTNQSVFLLVWSVVMLLLTIRFQRFQYYFTVNVVILAALCISEPFGWKKDTIVQYLAPIISRLSKSPVSPINTGGDVSGNIPPTPKKDKKKETKRPVKNPVNYSETLQDLTVLAIVILTIGLIAFSLSQDIQYGFSTPQHEISRDWVESLSWLETNSPQTGIDYFTSYEARGFSYPQESYGIMAVWDAGHWITFFAHRIPITNPFQNNLGGRSGAAAYFLSQNESQADEILHSLGGKYVITNSDMAVDTFTNLIPWPSGSVDISPYIKWFMVRDSNNPSHLQKVHRYDDAYFKTMVSRLHNFDGSMQIPKTETFVQYVIRQVPAAGETAGDVNGYARVITSEQERDVSPVHNDTQIVREGKDLKPGRYASVFSDLPNRTVQEIPALKHYRLIHESPNNASVKIFPESDTITLSDIKYVKIFEYVKGAHISGEGIIEVPLVTNTGRAFVYRQESENGEFVVPYSTQGNPNDVRATGQYHVVGTSRFIAVTEKDVTEGNNISG
jgi:dolichyl-diphosphooligosaccharide--protein glycosyltransferase